MCLNERLKRFKNGNWRIEEQQESGPYIETREAITHWRNRENFSQKHSLKSNGCFFFFFFLAKTGISVL